MEGRVEPDLVRDREVQTCSLVAAGEARSTAGPARPAGVGRKFGRVVDKGVTTVL